MKTKNCRDTVLLLLLLNGCATSTYKPPTCQIVSFGTISESPHDREIGVSDLDPDVLVRNVKKKMEFINDSAKVDANLGSAFGVKHLFGNIPKGQRISVQITHPEIDYPQGKRSKARWTKNPTDIGTSFRFDLVEEVVPGTWKFSFSYKGKELCGKSFDVSSEA